MNAIIAVIVAFLKAVPGARDIVAILVREWGEYDRRAREKEAAERRDDKLKEAAAVLASSNVDRVHGGTTAVVDSGVSQPASPSGGQPGPNKISRSSP